MKIRKFPKFISRKYLRLASVYRRYAGRSNHFDFSVEMLVECFQHESQGKPASRKNGYVFGKWAKDITVATWREDITAGAFCKAEFYTLCDKWWAEPALTTLIVPTFFGFDVSMKHSIPELEWIRTNRELKRLRFLLDVQNELKETAKKAKSDFAETILKQLRSECVDIHNSRIRCVAGWTKKAELHYV